MKKLIVILLIFTNLLFAIGREDLDNDFFLSEYVSTSTTCEPSCRLVDESKYHVKMIDFDAKLGLTTCEVYYKYALDNETDKLSIMANTINYQCVNEQKAIQADFNDTTLASKTVNDYSSLANINNYDKSITTMSRFVGGLATLDEDIIDIKNTVDTSTLVKSDPNSLYAVDSADSSSPNELLNQVDSLNTQNLSYFVDLFYMLDATYEYASSYLFIFISLFFMIIYFSNFGLKKLAKKTISHDEAITAKLSVIIVSFIFFFFPVKFDVNYSSTLFQNIVKYFVYESTSLADKANNIALKSFLKYTYATSGASGIEGEATLKSLLKKEDKAIESYEEALTICEDRYPNETTFQITNQDKINQLEEKIGTIDDVVTIKGCRNIEKRLKVSYTLIQQYKYHLSRIENAYKNSEITDRLNDLSTLMNRRADEMGWYSALLVPSVKVLTELSYISSNSIPPLNEEVKGKIRKSQINPTDESNNWLEDILSNSTQYAQDMLGESMAKVVYMILPGASSLFEFNMQLGSGLSTLLSQIPIVGKTVGILSHMATPFASLALMGYIVTLILQALPLLTGIVATILAIVLYIYELILYVLISPFVVMFSVTTGQSRKIIDFLITGLTIFLKPVLIVISVYLAMFFYSFVMDNVIVFSLEQFNLLQNSTSGFWITLSSYLMKEILFIFSIFASMFVLWKTIVSGAEYVYKMIGLDSLSNTSQFAEELSNNYKTRYNFNA
jgi:tetratricopeptide (TPR) repeat protein